MTVTDPNDFLLSSGVPSFKFDVIGATAKGTIESLDMMQQKDITTGALLTWEDGRPKMQLRIVLTTDQRDPEIADDNGRRAIYVKGLMQQAVRDAIKTAGAAKIEVGGTLAVKYDSDGEPPKKGFNAPKQYLAKYEPPVAAPAAVDADDLF